MSIYSEAERAQIRRALIANQVKPDRAAQVVDLACHAAERAMEALADVIRGAPDSGIGMMAFEIALQLGRARMDATFERIHEDARAQGLPQYAMPVEICA